MIYQHECVICHAAFILGVPVWVPLMRKESPRTISSPSVPECVDDGAWGGCSHRTEQGKQGGTFWEEELRRGRVGEIKCRSVFSSSTTWRDPVRRVHCKKLYTYLFIDLKGTWQLFVACSIILSIVNKLKKHFTQANNRNTTWYQIKWRSKWLWNWG